MTARTSTLSAALDAAVALLDDDKDNHDWAAAKQQQPKQEEKEASPEQQETVTNCLPDADAHFIDYSIVDKVKGAVAQGE